MKHKDMEIERIFEIYNKLNPKMQEKLTNCLKEDNYTLQPAKYSSGPEILVDDWITDFGSCYWETNYVDNDSYDYFCDCWNEFMEENKLLEYKL